jgi:transposase
MRNRLYKQGKNRLEEAALPQRIENFVSADNPVRAIEAFVETLDLAKLGFENTQPNKTAAGQPAFSPALLLMLYLYGTVKSRAIIFQKEAILCSKQEKHWQN